MTEDLFEAPGDSFTAEVAGIKTTKIRSTSNSATPSPVPFFQTSFLIFPPNLQSYLNIEALFNIYVFKKKIMRKKRYLSCWKRCRSPRKFSYIFG